MDPIGDRMKQQYEDRARFYLPRRTYTILRVDGKSFHTYTRGYSKPYDFGLMRAMDDTAQFLCEEIQGARLAYIQSDEISVLLTDFEKITSSAWFDGNIQKMASVAAALATGRFNERIHSIMDNGIEFQAKTAFFDARVFSIPDPIEVENYFVWRQQDATRNSISMAAQSMFSHKELHGKDSSEQQEMMFQKGVNWNSYASRAKRGGAVVKETHMELPRSREDSGLRTRWAVVEPPIFTQDRDWLISHIPVHPDFSRIRETEAVGYGHIAPRSV